MSWEKVKIMEEAIETAGSEILEEILLMKENGVVSEGLDIITKVMEDLIETAKNPHRFEEHEETEESVHGINSDDDYLFKFKLREKVIVINPGKGYSFERETCKEMGHPEAAEDYLAGCVKEGERATVLARKESKDRMDLNIYVIQCEDKKFLIGEGGLKKIEE